MGPALSQGAFAAAFIVFIHAIATSQGAEWGYHGNTGPDKWLESYPHCGQDSQSPIDIEDAKHKDLGPLSFENYDGTSVEMSLGNNGHAAQVTVTGGLAYISGSGLADDKYQLLQFHFHWGSDSNQGSEHTVRGRKFPLEMHLVHFNEKYGNASTAIDKESDGLAVLGILFEVGSENAAFSTLIDALASVQAPESEVVIQPIRLDTLLPSNTADFYRYQGSLTTPHCYESVQWTVFENTVQLSEAQFAEFRKLKDDHQDDLVDNYRPVQALNGRDVYTTNPDATAAAGGLKVSMVTSLLILMTVRLS